MRIKINLLSPPRKKKLRADLLFGLVLDQVIKITLIFIVVLIGFYSIRVLLVQQEKNAASTNLQIKQGAAYVEIAELQGVFAEANKSSRILGDLYSKHFVWQEVIAMIELARPDGLAYTSIATKDIEVTLKGEADTIDDVVLLSENIGAQTRDDVPCFENIDIPDQFLVNNTRDDFEMTFTINYEQCLQVLDQ